MARPREFDLDTALDGAMDVFWAHGYDGSSLPGLLDGMGLTRGSLYKAFSDKKSLFINVLEHYEKHAVDPAVALLTGPEIPDGMDRIERLFALVVDAVRNGDRRGCLLCSAAAGPASDDTDIANVVQRLLGKMQAGFEIALAQHHSRAGPDRQKQRQIADLLLTQYVGLRILARSQTSVATLERSVSSLKLLLAAPK